MTLIYNIKHVKCGWHTQRRTTHSHIWSTGNRKSSYWCRIWWYVFSDQNNLVKNLINFSFQCSVKFYKGPVGKPNEFVKIVDYNMELCKFFQKNNKGNPFQSYYSKLFDSYGKTVTSCPVKVVSLSLSLNIIDYIKSWLFQGHYYVHNLTLNRLGIPNFSGFLTGDGDVIVKLSFIGKFKKKLVSLLNITGTGGYRFVK